MANLKKSAYVAQLEQTELLKTTLLDGAKPPHKMTNFFTSAKNWINTNKAIMTGALILGIGVATFMFFKKRK